MRQRSNQPQTVCGRGGDSSRSAGGRARQATLKVPQPSSSHLEAIRAHHALCQRACQPQDSTPLVGEPAQLLLQQDAWGNVDRRAGLKQLRLCPGGQGTHAGCTAGERVMWKVHRMARV